MRGKLQFDHCAGGVKTSSGSPRRLLKPRTKSHLWMWAALLAAAMPLASTSLWAQHNGGYTNGASAASDTMHSANGTRDPDSPQPNPRMQEQLADRRNSERQKQLMADTEKLFQLAQQLRDEVAKSNKDQLSIPVVKKSEEIEKLAKSVKEKMRGY